MFSLVDVDSILAVYVDAIPPVTSHHVYWRGKSFPVDYVSIMWLLAVRGFQVAHLLRE